LRLSEKIRIVVEMKPSWHDSVLMAIPSINGGELLDRMLPTLRVAPSSVVVIDQGSTDDTGTICARAGVEVLQLGRPHSYTEACNIGADLARRRGRRYLCVSNNDIAFRTDVMSAMHAAMEQDPWLGIVAPAQIMHVGPNDNWPPVHRVYWDLEKVEFLPDFNPQEDVVNRLEADFCELTCALVRVSAIEAIGFLDNEYGYYHEDADFGFRLRKAGYSCAYLPKAQIDHFVSSTINRDGGSRKQEYSERNKRLFVCKHLGFAVGQNLPHPDGQERSLLNQGIQACLTRYGLVAHEAPELAVSYSAPDAAGYLFTSLQAGPNFGSWIAAHRKLKAVFTTSAITRDLLAAHGISHCFHVPLGIDPDIFHPWGPARRLNDGRTIYLAVLHGQQYQLLRVILKAWHRFAPGRAARLVLYGPGLGGCIGRVPDFVLRVGKVELSRYEDEGIDVHDVLQPCGVRDLAQLYRSADYTIIGARGEDSALAALQSAACGVPCLLVDLHRTADFPTRAAVATDHLAPGIADPGDRLYELLQATLRCSSSEHDNLAVTGMLAVRKSFTVRSTAMGLHQALSRLQIRRPLRVLERLEPPQLTDVLVKSVAAPPARRSPLGAKVARRVETFGRITEGFGSAWRNIGFLEATRGVGKEVAYFASGTANKVSRIAFSATRRLGFRETEDPGVPPPCSVLLIGDINARVELGQCLRDLALAMSRNGVPFGIYSLNGGRARRRSTPYMPERYVNPGPHAVNVIEAVPGELPGVIAKLGDTHFLRSYNVLRTYCELSTAPQEWRPLLELIDELWVPNAFVREGFRAIFDRTITIVPPCVCPEQPEPGAASSFGLVEGVFYFMLRFDDFWFPRRNNPLGVVRAFRRAFPDNPEVGLIIKSNISSCPFPELRNEMRLVAQDDDRIRLIDEELSPEEMLALLAAADCYVSLHRSENCGLEMVESMALGKPVIGTDYSGSTDFLRDGTGYPIPYTLTPLRPHDYAYTEGQVWAEPDEAACAAAMVRVVRNPIEVASKTEAARLLVSKHYGPDVVWRIVANRLAAIFPHGPTRRPSPASADDRLLSSPEKPP
jgi:glycosyltransferase involved in cell wall biosynthesis